MVGTSSAKKSAKFLRSSFSIIHLPDVFGTCPDNFLHFPVKYVSWNKNKNVKVQRKKSVKLLRSIFLMILSTKVFHVFPENILHFPGNQEYRSKEKDVDIQHKNLPKFSPVFYGFFRNYSKVNCQFSGKCACWKKTKCGKCPRKIPMHRFFTHVARHQNLRPTF